ncbi:MULTISPECIES: hypothetical protein [unclassified Cryobacterium]|uniref:hypothetical protein n=1 Tax=unclassified Cryobacterium TaxID=2649013 RepID=UPI002AB4153A|nr:MULTISPECIES: hypothetical protein [unclassified Cryobacterium]MDY7542614.1 hypothetical protein [Cryobacterium sp. 5B3]MEB0264734.1 hypothetical protein [Cryobacterium sp. 10I5]MEB0273706.1 hypothetical protein [Cryobacterium sp. 5B3]
MARETFRSQKGAEARRLFDDGRSCAEIAKLLDSSKATVSRWAKAEGLLFDRSQTAAATVAKQVDLTEARMNLAHRLNKAALDMLDMLDKPFEVFNFGGSNNTFASKTLDSVPVEARRTIITSTAIVFDKISRIVEKDNGGLETTVGVLDALSGNLAAAAALLRDEDSTPVTDADAV